MIKRIKRAIASGLQSMAAATGIPEQIRDVKTEVSRIDLASRRAHNELAAGSQCMQLLLARHYQELVRQKLPLPDLSSTDFPSTEFRCFSQNGEDGILLYVFSVVGTTNKQCVEICAGDGVECNTANLIINHGWKGLLFDGNEGGISAGKQFYSQCRDTFVSPPTLVTAWITPENVNTLVTGNGFEGEIDLLSLDMDGLDYWVLKALTAVRPRVLILEYNTTLGPHRAVTVPCKSDFCLDYSKQPYYCGASLAAFEKLGRERGYRLVGVQRQGFNAIFLRSDVGANLIRGISPAECFEKHLYLRGWDPNWIPSISERPEWGDLVEV